jgi:hypothetical protein
LLSPVPHDDMVGHSIRHVSVCALSGFPHALHIGLPFSESSGTSNIFLSLGFSILLLLRWILLVFLMMILLVVGLIVRALLVLVIFLDLLLFVGLLKNNHQLSNPP